MNIDAELKKDGITVIEPLDEASIDTIAKNVSQMIVDAFPNFGFTFDMAWGYSTWKNLQFMNLSIIFKK